MQEVDEAIQKAEIASLTMEKIKISDTNDLSKANSGTKLPPEKVCFCFGAQVIVYFLYLYYLCIFLCVCLLTI